MSDEQPEGRPCGVGIEQAKCMGMALALIMGMLVWSPNAFARTFVGHVLTVLPLVTYHGSAAPVQSVAWSSDGKHLASAGDDGTVQVWDGSTGQPLLTNQRPGS